MPRLTSRPKDDSFNLRLDPKLKAAFQKAAEAEDKPAAQILRDFMRVYVSRQVGRGRAAEARRQSLTVARSAANPTSDEAAVTRWIEEVSDASGWTA